MNAMGKSLRFVAMFEAAKGALVLLAGCGLLRLVHRDVGHLAEVLVRHSHLNPAHRFPRIFLDAATRADDRTLRLLALGAFGYAAFRLVEAWGLWRDRRWAEWLGAVSGGFYIPMEIYEIAHGATWLKVLVLALNALCVAFLLAALFGHRRPPHGPSATVSRTRDE